MKALVDQIPLQTLQESLPVITHVGKQVVLAVCAVTIVAALLLALGLYGAKVLLFGGHKHV